MKKNLRHLLDEIQQLEAAVTTQLRRSERKFLVSVLNRRASFPPRTLAGHRARRHSVWATLWRTPILQLVVSPAIYAFIVPALILDASSATYQALIFTVYAIPKARRSDYIVMDRGQLLYLNWLERLNCDYCSYVNGLVAWTREIASRTEQYFCPIRHAVLTLGLHPRHQYFLPYGDAHRYHAKLEQLRALLKKGQEERP